MGRLHATSYSATLDLAYLPTLSRWSVLSSHRHACNLLAADGTLIALVNETHGNGPFHIVIPGARFDDIDLAAPVIWQEQQLQIGRYTIAWRQAEPWQPTLPSLHAATPVAILKASFAVARQRSALYSGPAAITTRAQTGIAALHQGLQQTAPHQIQQGVLALAGLGPGLTPAGDDFLLGLFAALTARTAHEPTLDALRAAIVDAAPSHTTHLSAQWLIHASRGQFAEPWHQLVSALNHGARQPTVDAAQAILAIGATSGADALWGFQLGLSG